VDRTPPQRGGVFFIRDGREDNLDVVIRLTRPPGHRPEDCLSPKRMASTLFGEYASPCPSCTGLIRSFAQAAAPLSFGAECSIMNPRCKGESPTRPYRAVHDRWERMDRSFIFFLRIPFTR
jgi:hypothetical protein